MVGRHPPRRGTRDVEWVSSALQGLDSSRPSCLRSRVAMMSQVFPRLTLNPACRSAFGRIVHTHSPRGLSGLGRRGEVWPQRGQFSSDFPPHRCSQGAKKGGEKWTAAVTLQPTLPQSDRLPGQPLLARCAGLPSQPGQSIQSRHGRLNCCRCTCCRRLPDALDWPAVAPPRLQ